MRDSRHALYDRAFVHRENSGFTIAGLPIASAEFVQVIMAFRSGTVAERPGEEGYCELLSTLLCWGAGPWNRREFALECDKRGASLQVFASRDLFVFDLSVLPEDLEWGIGLLGRMILEPRLESEDIAVAVEEQRDQNAARADEQRTAHGDLARRTLFVPEHAYARPVSGFPHSLVDVSRATLEAFHRHLLLGTAPVAFCVTGHFEPQDMLTQVSTVFGALMRGRDPHGQPRSRSDLFAANPERFQQLEFPVDQNRVLIGLPAVGRGDPFYLEHVIANELFGGAFLSRLTRAVRSKEGLAYSAGSLLWSAFQGGCLWISLQTENKNVPKALRTVRAVMEQLKTDGLPVTEVEQFRQFAQSSLTFEYDSLSGLTSRLLDHVLFDEPWLPNQRRADLQRRIQTDSLEASLQGLLRPEVAVLCLSGRPAPGGSEEAFFTPPTAAQRRSLSVAPLGPMSGPTLPEGAAPVARLVASHPKGSLLAFPNGLHLLSLPRPELLSISLQIWTRTGSMDEPPGASGMSHLLEHLMFRGTERFPDGEFDAILAQKGGVNNAFTSEDFTVYTDYVVADGLAEALCLEADRFAHLQIDDELFTTEREVVLEERSLRVDSNPLGKVYEQLQKTAFPEHPYGWPVIGWREDLQQLTNEKLRAHYQAASAPERLLLVIAGGCDTDTAVDLVGRAFQDYRVAETAPVKATWPVLVQSCPIEALLEQTIVFEERAGYSYLLAAFRFPREGHGDYEAAELLSRILGHGDSSRLHDYFVRRQRTALEAWVSYEPQTRDHPLLHIGLATTDDFDLETRKAELAQFLRELPDSLTVAELEKARRGWIAEAAFGTDELEDWAVEIAGRVMVLPWDEVWQVRQRMESVSMDQLVSAARTYLKPEAAVYAHLRAQPEAGSTLGSSKPPR